MWKGFDMCRGKNESGSRRCPCDTSEKRRLRRVNRGKMGEVDTVKLKAAEEIPVALTSNIEGYTPTTDPRKNIAALQKIYRDEIRWPEENLEIVREIGKESSKLAYEKAGVTEEEYKEAVKMRAEKNKIVEAQVDKMIEHRNSMYELDRDSEEYQEAHEEWDELNEEKKKLQEDRNEISDKADEIHQKLGRAYIETISEVRGEEMGVGEEGLVLAPKAPSAVKKAGKDLEGHLGCYPRSWIETSNERGNLYPQFSRKRAHYRGYHTIASGETRIIPHSFSENEVPLEWAHKYREITPEEREEQGLNEWNSPDEKLYEELNVTFHSEFRDGYDEDGNPRGKGWKKITVYQRTYDEVEYKKVEKWARVRRARRQPVGKKIAVSQLTFPEYSLGNVARHEFAHRMEHLHPEIGHLEESFLEDRKGEDEETVRIYKGKQEYAYADSFNETYTGKIYGGRSMDDKNQVFHEVLSTSVEDMFSKSSSAGVISSQGKLDLDLRNFTLGVLASVRLKKDDN